MKNCKCGALGRISAKGITYCWKCFDEATKLPETAAPTTDGGTEPWGWMFGV